MRGYLSGLTFCVILIAPARAAVDVGPAVAPRMDFTPLPAGTYSLPAIQTVRDAVLLDEYAQPVHLRSLTAGKITLLTFFYTYCVDPLGCPSARETLTMLRDRILADRPMAADVRFVGITCDPLNDTPQVLSEYRASFASGRPFEWRFLTAKTVPALLPVLQDLGQDVSVDIDAEGNPTRALHHMLKVFLIDPRGRVREIYSLAFIQPEVMLNDIRTLYLESSARKKGVTRRDRYASQADARDH
jgi:protein SCO1/2